LTTFSSDALWNKSRVFIERAIKARDNEDMAGFHLWAAIAIELLAKSALAHQHPVLIADPMDFKSLFAACGVKDAIDKHTITAKTLYDRLHYINNDFDDAIKKECMFLANRRNAELHSGESPTEGLDQRTWSPGMWKAASVLVTMLLRTLDDWVGPDEASRIKRVLADRSELLRQGVVARIARRSSEYRARFESNPRELEEAIARSQNRTPPRAVLSGSDDYEEVECPSCRAKAWLMAYEGNSEVIDSGEEFDGPHDYYRWERVATTYYTEEFRCVECSLSLNGSEEIKFAGLATEFRREEDREPDYEPEYGND